MVAAIRAFLETLGSGAGYFILLLASGFVFLCMVVLSFAGGGDSDGAGADSGGDLDTAGHTDSSDTADTADSHSDSHLGLLKHLSIRNCVNYLLGFSLCGFLSTLAGAHPFVSGMLALAGGFFCAIIMYKLMGLLYYLADSQPLSMEEAIGSTARVYIAIGPRRSARGKILLTLKGAQREFTAVTDCEQSLKASSMVRVTDWVEDCYVVAPLDEASVGEQHI